MLIVLIALVCGPAVATIDHLPTPTSNPTPSTTAAAAHVTTMGNVNWWHLPRQGYECAVIQPIYRLYRNGPALHGYGFWRGAPATEVCAALTNVESKFWRKHPEQCDALIHREVEAYVVLVETVAYFALIAWAARWLLAYCGGRLQQRAEYCRSQRYQRRHYTPLRRSTPRIKSPD